MLDNALRTWFGKTNISRDAQYELYYVVTGESRPLFFMRPRITVYSLLILNTRTVPFTGAADTLLSELNTTAHIKCRWLVSSEGGGIYLYEAVATKSHALWRNMRNSFLVINSNDGTVSFGPGHRLNASYTERLNELVVNSRLYTEAEWLKLTGLLVEAALEGRDL
jgi:hypothetical protein